MERSGDVAIIGAGITGLTCARALHEAGLRITVFDKGRGAGGRLSTRRAGALRFDHGAQVLPEDDPEFSLMLRGLGDAGHAAWWLEGGGHVGLPGMAQIGRALGQGLDLRQGGAVQRLTRQQDGWHLGGEGIGHHATRVVVAIPAPQAADLLGRDHAFTGDLGRVRHHACVTLMAGLDPAAPRPFVTRTGTGALAWIAQDGAKPGRAGQPLTTWVVQADPDWSAARIDLPFAELVAIMAPPLLEVLGARPDHLRHAVVHRWLYARTDRALGRAFLADDAAGLIVGGDWTLGNLARHGWTSGRAMAVHLLARP